MALERHVVELSARDNLSPILKNVARQAEQTGRTAETANQRAAASSKEWGRAASALGTGLGVLTFAAVKLGNESEVANQRLQASIEATGKSYDDYADQIDAAAKSALELAFDDEDAIDALSALTQGTGDAGKALADLALVEDIARARGIDLASASKIVIAAEQGRITSLKRLGISLDANATSQEALAALQQRYAGQAESYAETNAATWDRVQNRIENALEGIGGTLADYQGLILGLSTAGAALGPLGSAFDALGGKAKLASVGAKALSLAMSPTWLLGPAGFIAAAGLGAAAILAFGHQQDQAAISTENLSGVIDDNTTSLLDNAAAYQRLGLLSQVTATEDLFAGLLTSGAQATRTLEDIGDAIVELRIKQTDSLDFEGFEDSLSSADAAWLESVFGNGDGRLSLEELAAAQDYYTRSLRLTEDQVTALDGDMDQLLELISNPDFRGSEILADVQKVLTDKSLTGDQLVSALQAIIDKRDSYNITLTNAAAAENRATDAYRYASTEWKASVPVIAAVTTEVETQTDAIEEWSTAAFLASDQYKYWSTEQQASVPVITAVTSGLTSAATGISAFGQAAGASTADTAAFDAQLTTLAETLKADLPGAAGAAYNRVVGFTSGMVDSINKSKDWADALIAPVGVYSELDNMLAAGQISIEDYNEAQQAQIDITDASARATAAANIIQAEQAETVAAGADATADYLENLAALPEHEQALALAWADTDLAGRANDISAMAANFGTMSDAQKEAFGSMVTSAAATDPQLALVLENLGLIKADVNDPTGWSLVIDDSAAAGALSDTSTAIGDLITVLAEAYHLNVDAILDDSGFWARYNALPNYKTIYVNYDEGTGYGGIGRALGGTIPWEGDTAALGRLSAGRMTMVGEHGPELALLPGGTNIIPNHASRYMDKGRGGGGITFNGPITVIANDPQSFMRQMRAYSTTMERR